MMPSSFNEMRYDAIQKLSELTDQNERKRHEVETRLNRLQRDLKKDAPQWDLWDALIAITGIGLIHTVWKLTKTIDNELDQRTIRNDLKDLRKEGIKELKEWNALRKSINAASERAANGNSWMIPNDRYNALQDLINNSKTLDTKTRSALSDYLNNIKGEEQRRIQVGNQNKLLSSANDNKLFKRDGSQDRLTAIKTLAEQILKKGNISQEDKQFYEKLTKLSSEQEDKLMEKLKNPNSFKTFEDLKQTVEAIQNEHSVQDKNQSQQKINQPQQINNPEERRSEQENQMKPGVQPVEIPMQNVQNKKTIDDINNADDDLLVDLQSNTKLNDDKEFDDSIADEYSSSTKTTASNQPQQKSQQNPQTQNASQQKITSISYNPSNPNQFAVKRQGGNTTVQTKASLQNKIKNQTSQNNLLPPIKSKGSNQSFVEYQTNVKDGQKTLKVQGRDNKVVDHNDIQISFESNAKLSAPSVQGNSGKIQQKGIV